MENSPQMVRLTARLYASSPLLLPTIPRPFPHSMTQHHWNPWWNRPVASPKPRGSKPAQGPVYSNRWRKTVLNMGDFLGLDAETLTPLAVIRIHN